jgi:hypothetical protein
VAMGGGLGDDQERVAPPVSLPLYACALVFGIAAWIGVNGLCESPACEPPSLT